LVNWNGETAYPAYLAYTYARQTLRDASFRQEITSYPGVRVYEFHRGDRKVWVLWSMDNSVHAVTLPGVPEVIGQWDSASHQYVSGTRSATISIGLAPVYLEWLP
jgi:hypothetical protein